MESQQRGLSLLHVQIQFHTMKLTTQNRARGDRHFTPIVVTSNGTLRKLTLPDLESVSGSDEDEDLEIVD